MDGARLTREIIVVASGDQVSRTVGEEAVILGDGKYFGLNPVGTRVWSLIQEPRVISDVCDTIQAEYEIDAETCQRDVIDLLERLAEEKLVEVRL